MKSHLSRRSILVASSVLVAGCSSLPFLNATDGSMPDIYIWNNTTNAVTFELTVEGRDEERTIIDEKGELAPENQDGYVFEARNPITKPGTYSLQFRASNGRRVDFQWDEISEPSSYKEDKDGLQIILYSNRAELEWNSRTT